MGILTNALSLLNVLVGREDVTNSRGTTINRALITAIECIFADGRCLFPLLSGLPAHIGALGPHTQLLDGTLRARRPGIRMRGLACIGYSMSSIL